MPLSRFTVLPQQQVINSYVSPNLQYANAALHARQGAYDEGQAFDEQQDGAFGKFAVRNVDIARRDQLHDDYVARAQQLVADKYQGDYGQALPELRRLAASTGGNEFWNRATSALSRQKDMYETEKGIQKKGGTSLAFNRDAATKPIYDPANGEYSDVDYDVQERLDYAKPKTELMKDIAKDTRLAGLSQSQIDGVLQYGSAKGVDAAKVFGVAKQMLMPYMSTPEGQQEMRYYLRNGATPEQAQATMLRSLAGIGSKQVGSELEQGFHNDPAYLYRLKKADKAAAANADLLELPAGETGATVNPLAPSQLKVDEQGRAYTEVQKTTNEDFTDPMTGQVIGSGPATRTVRDYGGGKAVLADMRKSYVKLHPEDANISDRKLAAITKSAIENSGLVTYTKTGMAPKRADIVSKMVLGTNYKKGDISNLSGSQIEILSPNGGSKKITLQELQKEIGDDKTIKSAQVTGDIKNHATIPGAYRVTMTVAGENGKGTRQIELAVSGPKQEQEFKAQYQPLVESAYNGKPGRVQIGNARFTSISAPRPDGKGFSTQVRGYETLPNGNVVPLRERNRDGSVKMKNGRPVYAPNQSLEQFTNSMDNLFQQAHPDLYNGTDYTSKEAEEEIDIE